MTYAEALEAFNRASHSDALPEMQLVPAEEVQRELPLEGVPVPLWLYPATAALAILAIIVWSNS